MKSCLSSRLFVLAVFVLVAGNASAQNKIPSEKTMRKKPVWIDMMRDTSSNFFATVRAFRLYYTSHYLAEEPDSIEKNDGFVELLKRLDDPDGPDGDTPSRKEEKRRRRRENGNPEQYAAEVKAFRAWYFVSRGWLRADGTIMGPLERQQVVDRQRAAQLQLEQQQ